MDVAHLCLPHSLFAALRHGSARLARSHPSHRTAASDIWRDLRTGCAALNPPHIVLTVPALVTMITVKVDYDQTSCGRLSGPDDQRRLG